MKRHPLATRMMTVRLALGMHQQDVATAGGLNRNTVGTIESGKRVPSLEKFDRYCRGLGYRLEVVPLDAPITELPEMPAIAFGTPGLYTVDEVAEKLRVSRSTVFLLVKSGQLGSTKTGRFRRFTDDHIRAYVEGGEGK